LSSANSLRNGGPVGLLLGYIIVGTICYSVMVGRPVTRVASLLKHYPQLSLGEMVSYLPIPGGHIKLAERFVDPAFSFVRDPAIWACDCPYSLPLPDDGLELLVQLDDRSSRRVERGIRSDRFLG
jgi:amino acid permease